MPGNDWTIHTCTFLGVSNPQRCSKSGALCFLEARLIEAKNYWVRQMLHIPRLISASTAPLRPRPASDALWILHLLLIGLEHAHLML
jgi:hypothetical protein